MLKKDVIVRTISCGEHVFTNSADKNSSVITLMKMIMLL